MPIPLKESNKIKNLRWLCCPNCGAKSNIGIYPQTTLVFFPLLSIKLNLNFYIFHIQSCALQIFICKAQLFYLDKHLLKDQPAYYLYSLNQSLKVLKFLNW